MKKTSLFNVDFKDWGKKKKRGKKKKSGRRKQVQLVHELWGGI